MVRIDEAIIELQALDRSNLMPSTQLKMNGYYKQLKRYSDEHEIYVVNQDLFDGFVADNNNSKDRFKAIRKHFALTQEQLAKKINRTSSFVSTVETGRCGLSAATVDTICSVFGVNEEWLRTGIGEMFVSSVPAVDKNSISGRMKEIRKGAGLTQQAFADKIGFHKNQVYNVETGKSIPSDDYISSVALKFQVSVSWLKTGEGEMRDGTPEIDERQYVRTLPVDM